MRGFGALESRVMELMWARQHAATVRDVLDALTVADPDRQFAYTTVMTVMDNLHRKGWLVRERDGRAFRYQSTAPREDYIAELMHDALSGSDDHATVMLSFTERLTDEESQALRAALRTVTRRKE